MWSPSAAGRKPGRVRNRHARAAHPGVALALTAVLAAWSGLRDGRAAEAQTTKFLGKVVPLPDRVAEILAPATGTIISPREKPYNVGDTIQQGEPIAILEHRYNLHDAAHLSNTRWDVLKLVLESHYAAVVARIEREKSERLLRLGSVSAAEVQERRAAEQAAQATYERYKSVLDQQDRDINQAKITRRGLLAPIAGEITFVNFTQGQPVYEGNLLYRITNRREVGVLVRVPDSQYHPWASDVAARIRFDSLPGKLFTGRLVQPLPVVDPESRTRELLLRVENPEELLRFGMIGQVEVPLR